MSGIDLLIPELNIFIHQPRIREIAFLGEKNFFSGAQCLCINKSMYQDEQHSLDDISNFQLLISILNEPSAKDKKQDVLQLLQIMLPQYKIFITPRSILLNLDSESFIIDEANFDIFQDFSKQIFCLGKSGQESFNPANKKAKEIADKLMRARAKVAAIKAAENQTQSVFAQYISVLCVALKYPVETVLDMTVFQLYDLIERNSMYIKWDVDVKSMLAGAKLEKGPDDWTKSIH